MADYVFFWFHLIKFFMLLFVISGFCIIHINGLWRFTAGIVSTFLDTSY